MVEVTLRSEFIRLFSLLKSYIEVTKPRSVFLLVFTSLVTMVIAVQEISITPLSWFKALLSITLACSGVNAVSCYIDRDLDAGMERTRNRPIPSGRISPAIRAMYWGLGQFMLALVVAWTINLLSFLCIFAGMVGYVGLYSLMLKRRTPWNIILGGFSGGLPALFGWVAVTNEINLTSILISVLVVLWIPNHIWNLAIFFKDDYRRVGVPMLPVVCEVKKTLLYILLTVILMVATSISIYLYSNMGPVYLWTAILSGTVLLAGNLYLYYNCEKKNAWFLYKLSSPYLFILFLSMLIDQWLI